MSLTTTFFLTETDRWILSQTDEKFQPHTWEDLREMTANNDFTRILRWPSDLLRYIEWSNHTKVGYGSSYNYVMEKILGWTDQSLSNRASDEPLTDPKDYKVLLTEWPYALEAGIVHIVVWTKHFFETDPVTAHITPRARSLAEKFVERYFREPFRYSGSTDQDPGWPKDGNIQWFKAWAKLMSVSGVEHFHVFARHAPDELIRAWVSNPELLEKVKRGGRKKSLNGVVAD